MKRRNHRTVEERASLKAQILAHLAEGPKDCSEIAAALGLAGGSLGNYITQLMGDRLISRYQYRKGVFRYYIGNTAPEGSYRSSRPQPKLKAPSSRKYAIPVKKVTVRPFSLAGEAGLAAQVTLPAAPWEIAA